jgi:protein-S-isoprenylcysteine O-methyltransferase Ste14
MLSAAGVAVAAAGVISFNRVGTTLSPMAPKTATSLVSTGIYSITRNPMYLGWLVLVAGWAVYLSSWMAMLGPLAFWLYITRFQILPEEKALAMLFGSSFTEYTSRVRRWL